MSSNRLWITAELVDRMRRDGTILILTRHKAVPALLTWVVLSAAFAGGAMVLFNAGVHGIGPLIGTAVAVVGYPIVCVRNARRTAHRLVQPYDIGAAVASDVRPGRLRLNDPDTGYQIEYRTRQVRAHGTTAAVEVLVGKKRGLILVPNALLDPDDVTLLTHRI